MFNYDECGQIQSPRFGISEENATANLLRIRIIMNGTRDLAV